MLKFSWDRRSNLVYPSKDYFKPLEKLELFIYTDPVTTDDSSYFSILDRYNQVTTLTVSDVLRLIDLRSCVSHLSKLHTLCIVGYAIEGRAVGENEYKWILDELLADQLLCNMLLSVGLRKLVFSISHTIPTVMPIIHLIVERLPHLQIMEFDCDARQELPHLLHTLINGLVFLTFLSICGGEAALKSAEVQLKTRQTLDTRPFRSELFAAEYESCLFIWL